MTKEERVVNYYLLCNKLKDTIRTGWVNWNVNRDRVESVAEHIYGTLMLAIAMKEEYEYKIDLKKVLFMLTIHELGETVIGDLTPFEITREEKEKIEHEAVHKILSNLMNSKEIEDIFLEFDEHKTNESKFAYQCDKLECDLQCKMYDEEKCVDLDNQENNHIIHEERIQKMLKNNMKWSELWITNSQKRYNYDENFMKVSNYILNNDIEKNINLDD